jgi:hypothetical protein
VGGVIIGLDEDDDDGADQTGSWPMEMTIHGSDGRDRVIVTAITWLSKPSQTGAPRLG